MPSYVAEQQAILLIAEPKIIAVPTMDNHEPMTDLTNQQAIAYGPSPEIPNNIEYTCLRKTV